MLVIDTDRQVFNLDEICRGTLIYARHSTWQEGQTGIVTEASEDVIRVQYPPAIQNVLNHYFIPAKEAAEGEWEIRCSNDGLETVLVYSGRNQEENGGADGTEAFNS
ncbi:MAG: DUF5026 domain-containing protein [Lachnospiraceae bacterium]|nr:DUF5026 domain-containing protein [Lachnospiraceae bacterium]